jgi:hypothetical protein
MADVIDELKEWVDDKIKDIKDLTEDKAKEFLSPYEKEAEETSRHHGIENNTRARHSRYRFGLLKSRYCQPSDLPLAGKSALLRSFDQIADGFIDVSPVGGPMTFYASEAVRQHIAILQEVSGAAFVVSVAPGFVAIVRASKQKRISPRLSTDIRVTDIVAGCEWCGGYAKTVSAVEFKTSNGVSFKPLRTPILEGFWKER